MTIGIKTKRDPVFPPNKFVDLALVLKLLHISTKRQNILYNALFDSEENPALVPQLLSIIEMSKYFTQLTL